MYKNKEIQLPGQVNVLLLLLFVIAVRETYTGNQRWWVYAVFSIPLLALYIFNKFRKSRNDK